MEACIEKIPGLYNISSSWILEYGSSIKEYIGSEEETRPKSYARGVKPTGNLGGQMPFPFFSITKGGFRKQSHTKLVHSWNPLASRVQHLDGSKSYVEERTETKRSNTRQRKILLKVPTVSDFMRSLPCTWIAWFCLFENLFVRTCRAIFYLAISVPVWTNIAPPYSNVKSRFDYLSLHIWSSFLSVY